MDLTFKKRFSIYATPFEPFHNIKEWEMIYSSSSDTMHCGNKIRNLLRHQEELKDFKEKCYCGEALRRSWAGFSQEGILVQR